jgi:DNA mismatch repair protein MutS
MRSQAMPDPKKTSQLTPMMRQYYEIKSQVGEAIVLFRMGDFFEIFGDDAQKVAPLLQLVLTSREKGGNERIPFCGVPHHSARGYWLKLLKLGFKVAIVEQVEDPKEAKGLVRREVTKMMTPGCIDDPEGLDPDTPNYLGGCLEDPKSRAWAVALIDISTGEFRVGNVDSIAEVIKVFERHHVREIIARQFHHKFIQQHTSQQAELNKVPLQIMSEAIVRDLAEQRNLYSEQFGLEPLATQPCGPIVMGEALVTSILKYLQELKLSSVQIMSLRPLVDRRSMVIDETALRDLEIFATARRQSKEGTLMHEIDRTTNAMGARALRRALMQPLYCQEALEKRKSQVQALWDLGKPRTSEFRKIIEHSHDLERLLTRICNLSIQPSELAALRQTLEKINTAHQWLINQGLESAFADLAPKLLAALPLKQALKAALVDAPSALGSNGLIFQEGFNPQLDQLISLAANGSKNVQGYEAQLRQRTGIQSLKIKKHKSFGLLIEVTKSNLSRTPEDFVRRQTMVNCERFVTVELKELNDQLETASDQATELEFATYQNLLSALVAERKNLIETAESFAHLDFIQSMAHKGLEANYCLPELSQDASICLQGSRHPVVESFVGKNQFVPNDLNIQRDRSHALITGPNMAGKSTIMRQLALTAILHQVGSPVPAVSAQLPLFDRIFTRVGASDDLSRGHSTFMVEMTEAATILRQAQRNSLVILDEVGRGTSTSDGLAIAYAIFKDLVSRVGCYSFFATHYHELVHLTQEQPHVTLLKTEVEQSNDEIRFTHRLVSGFTESSYGIDVAQRAGIPSHVIAMARELLSEVEPEAQQKLSPQKSLEFIPVAPPPVVESTPLKSSADIMSRIESIKIGRLTPLDALNFLSDIQKELRKEQKQELFSFHDYQ